MKIGVVTVIPTPYRDAFWSALAKEPGVELHVYYCAAGKEDRPWSITWSMDFPHTILPGMNLLKPWGQAASLYWNRSLVHQLRQDACDVLLIGGYNHLTMLRAIRYANRQDMPWYMMCETYYRPSGNALKQALKKCFLTRLLRRAAGGLPTGSWASAYLERYGCKHQVRLPNVPDLGALRKSVDLARTDREAFRVEQGLGPERLVLFAGRLIPKKRARLLFEAFRAMSSDEPVQLVFLGEGPGRAELEALIARAKLDRVHVMGFVQPDQLPAWYAAADLLVLPSAETWGVVVVEALAAGLQVIVTDKVGCHPDAVVDANCGTVVPLDDVDALQAALEHWLDADLGLEDVTQAFAPVFKQMSMPVLTRDLVSFLKQGQVA